MTSAGQKFWHEAEKRRPLNLPECPCCGRPFPIGDGVLDHALVVAEATYGVSRAAVLGPSSTKPISSGRALTVWALRTLGRGLSYPVIGQKLGGRHHSTIVSLHQKAISARLRDPQFAQACDRIVFAVTAAKENLDAIH